MSAHLDMKSKGACTAYETTGAAMLARIELGGRVTNDMWEENVPEPDVRLSFVACRALGLEHWA